MKGTRPRLVQITHNYYYHHDTTGAPWKMIKRHGGVPVAELLPIYVVTFYRRFPPQDLTPKEVVS